MKSSWTRKSRTRLLAAMLLLLPVVSACGIGGGDDPDVADIDAPPASVEQSMLEQTDGQPTHPSIATVDNALEGHAVKAGDTAGQAGQVSEEAAGDTVTVYLLDRNGYVAPMTLRTATESGGNPIGRDDAASQSLAETALSWMIENPERKEQLPPGFSALLPAGTKINSVVPDAKSRSVTIDFAEPLPGLEADKGRKAIEALVWTMTELPGTDSVKLTVAGKPLQLLPGSSIPVDSKLTRGIGINVETAKDVQTSRAMGVTLYFSARSSEGEGYFVPVTRLINRQPDRARAALQELIKGPQDLASLNPVLTTDLTVDQLSTVENTVDLSLKDAGWSPQSPVPAEMMQALVLTMTEATGAPQVKLAMNGDDSFVDSDSNSYDHPVTRPTAINSLKR